MSYFIGTKTQISPCIAAKVKYALNISNRKPSNTKKCSRTYWVKAIETFSQEQNISIKIKEEAYNKYYSLIK